MPNPDHDRSNLDEVRRNVLKNNYDRLVRQYTETAEKAMLNLNPGDRIALEEEAKKLWERAKAVDEELRQLDSQVRVEISNDLLWKQAVLGIVAVAGVVIWKMSSIPSPITPEPVITDPPTPIQTMSSIPSPITPKPVITDLPTPIQTMSSIPSLITPEPVHTPVAPVFDIRKLVDLLASGNWKEADKETDRLMPKDLGCQDLTTINALWISFSGGIFGYSPQREIWENHNKNYREFGITVGWRRPGNFSRESDAWTFSIDNLIPSDEHIPIPPEGKGFLPFSGWQIDGSYRKGFGDFMEKLSTCKIPISPSPKP